MEIKRLIVGGLSNKTLHFFRTPAGPHDAGRVITRYYIIGLDFPTLLIVTVGGSFPAKHTNSWLS